MTMIMLQGACGKGLFIDHAEISTVTSRYLFGADRTEVRLRSGKIYFVYNPLTEVLDALAFLLNPWAAAVLVFVVLSLIFYHYALSMYR